MKHPHLLQEWLKKKRAREAQGTTTGSGSGSTPTPTGGEAGEGVFDFSSSAHMALAFPSGITVEELHDVVI